LRLRFGQGALDDLGQGVVGPLATHNFLQRPAHQSFIAQHRHHHADEKSTGVKSTTPHADRHRDQQQWEPRSKTRKCRQQVIQKGIHPLAVQPQHPGDINLMQVFQHGAGKRGPLH